MFSDHLVVRSFPNSILVGSTFALMTAGFFKFSFITSTSCSTRTEITTKLVFANDGQAVAGDPIEATIAARRCAALPLRLSFYEEVAYIVYRAQK